MASPFDDIFGSSGPQWTREQIIARIRGEADAQKVDPDLALAVAMQESSLKPDNHGDNGKSRGLFHLQEKAAIDAGINPKWRDDPGVNIYGGVRYLRQKLDQSGGNVEQALSRYNRGTPDYRGIGDPNYVNHVLRHYAPSGALAKQQPTLLERAWKFVQPASAEAATPQAAPRSRLDELEAELARREGQTAPAAGTYSDSDVQNALQALQGAQAPQGGTYGEEDIQNALTALQGTPASAAPPSPPTSTSTPEQDAAYRASRGPQTPAGTPTTARSRLEELEAELARRETPQAPGTVWDDIFGAQQPPGSPTRPQAQAAQPPAEEPITFERRFLDLPSVQQLPLEERTQRFKEFYRLKPELKEEFLRSEEPPSDLTVAIEKPSPTAPRTPEERQARVREELAAWEQQAGRPWREGDPRMPSEKRLGLPDEAPVEEGWTKPSTLIPLIMGVGIPGLTTAAPGMAAAERLVGKAGPLITRGARAIGEGLSQTLGWGTGRTIETGQVPSPGEIGTEAALNIGAGGALETLRAGTRAVLRRSRAGKAIAQADEVTETARSQWQQEVQTARQAQQQGQADLYDRALEKAKEAQREYQAARQRRDDIIATNQQEYDWAVRSQGEALQRARQVSGNYRPETPSWTLYEKFGDAAKDATVDLAPARTALAEVRASRGVLPDGSVRPFPQAVENIAANLEKATGETSVQTIRNELRRLGPLTRHADGNIRGSAKQLYGLYADALEASPVANDLLRQANATFRKEMALQDVQEWLRPGHGIVRIDNQGRETINVGALMTRLEKHIGDDTFFAKSFTPDELQAMRHDVGRLAGTPTMPRTPPGIPREVSPPDLELLPGGAGAMRRPPEIPPQPGESRPTVERPRIFPRGSEWASQAGKWGGLLYVLDQIGVSPKTVAALKLATVTQQQGSWLLAKALLTPRLRPLLEAGMAGNGQIHQGTYKAIMAAMNAREKSQMERETRGKR